MPQTEYLYPSYALVPLDPYEGDDHDDRAVPVEHRAVMSRSLAAHETLALKAESEFVVTRRVVPFIPASRGSEGPHVEAIKRAHSRYRGGGRLALLQSQTPKVRRTYGRFFVRQIAEDQERFGIERTGSYDDATWRALAPWFDSYALSLLHPAPVLDPKAAKLTGWLQEFYAGRAGRPYSQDRPSQVYRRASLVTKADCSGMVAGGCSWAGIFPLVDWRWTNTDSQIKFGSQVIRSRSQVQPLDIAFYGDRDPLDPSHVAMVVSIHPEIIVQSFGSYPCALRSLDYRSDLIQIRRFL